MREKAKIYLKFITGLVLLSGSSLLHSQPVPAGVENIPYLMTFGKSGSTSWGDDDFSQTFFFKIPKGYTDPFYIRVYDPDIGGDVDEINGQWDTRMSYSVYGGATSYTHADAKGLEPTGKYRSGTLLASKVFVMDNRYDQSWYTFGPFNPAEGEFVEEFDGYIFKIICEGESGDDGNLYRYYLSKSANDNIPIENGNAFTYEYSFRMWNDMENVSHIYPYVDTSCIFVKQRNFDWDDDGVFRVISVSRKGQTMLISNEDDWADSKIKLFDDEKNTSLDFQFYKKKSALVRNNNVVISVENQYGELLPFFTIPIGGVPVFKAKTAGKPVPDTRNKK